jgi:hypothetical protein
MDNFTLVMYKEADDAACDDNDLQASDDQANITVTFN